MSKPMNQWNDSEVKAWINSLGSLNAKQKQLICNGVDSIGCDGDSLACAETPDELKDALEIPIILARKLHKEVSDKLRGAAGPAAGAAPTQPTAAPATNAPATNAATNAPPTNKIMNAPAGGAAAAPAGGGEAESEEAVLARLIARNLAAKKQAPAQPQAQPMNAAMGMGMGMNNMGMGGAGAAPMGMGNANAGAGAGGVKSLFTWGQNPAGGAGAGMMGQASNDFKVNIQGSNGKLISLNQKCNKHSKIRQVKQMLASQEGGDPAKMVMKYNGRTMDDMQNLGFYGIADSRNLITVTFKVVGGLF